MSEEGALRWSWCPLLPAPTAGELRGMLSAPGGVEEVTRYYADREKRIALAASDPYRHGFELPIWKVADEELAGCSYLYVAGGKRAGKSEWAAKRVLQSALTYPGGMIWCFQDNERTSIDTMQEYMWRYLPQELRERNMKQSPAFKIKYQAGRGFTDMLLVLPNRTVIRFLTYNQDPTEFQGGELGARVPEPRRGPDGRVVENIGCWADENLTVGWWKTIQVRLVTRSAKLIWTYSPLNGITPAIKEFRGVGRTVRHAPSELLAGRRNVADCPVGTMPVVEQPQTAGGRVVYFHSKENPWGNYEGLARILKDQPSERVMQDAYGYATDTVSRAFPLFGSWNVVRRRELPAEGTNYLLVDPAGSRNFASMWVRVTPGAEPKYFIYRDWPDLRRYGEWAKLGEARPGERIRWDGEPGPAQRGLGYGVAQYKRVWLAEESCGRQERAASARAGDAGAGEKEGKRQEARAEADGKGEVIYRRLIDPRAGRNQHIAEQGGTCLIDDLAAEQVDPVSGERTPGMAFEPAPGLDVQEGVLAINKLLYWDKEQPLCAVTNEPHLYVCEDCEQVIWALGNWTGLDGEKGACKDWVDLVRYMATAELCYVAPGAAVTRGGGGGY